MKFFKNKLTVLIMILSVGFLFLIGYSVKRDSKTLMESGVGTSLNGFNRFVYSVNSSIKEFGYLVLNYGDIKKENIELRKKNSELERKAYEYDELKAENDRLRDILDFEDRNSQYDYVTTHIINRSGGGLLDGYTLDKGARDGVSKNMVVVTSEGLVGQITTVAETWSIVETIGNENIAVAAVVDNNGDNNGIIKGYREKSNPSMIKMYSLPQKSTVKTGDVVTTWGEDFIYPKGIRIGKVVSVEEDKAKVMKNALIEPFVDFNQIQELIIIVPKDKSTLKYQGEGIK